MHGIGIRQLGSQPINSAHIKAALTQTSLGIPVARGRMVLGTWQGIFLFEHRERPHRREIVLHLST